MTGWNRIIIACLAYGGAAMAQSLESARSLAFDRGLVDAATPFTASGNPALLLPSSFRFFGELQHAGNTAFLVSIAYPVSISTGMSLSWNTQTKQVIQTLPSAVIGIEEEKQSFLISLGHRHPINWGQQIEMTFESDSKTFQFGSEAAENSFDDNQSFILKYRLGVRHQFSDNLAFGLFTPPLVSYRYRTVNAPNRPRETKLTYWEETETGSTLPLAAILWKPFSTLAFALSNRSLAGETDFQLAVEKKLSPLFAMTTAVTTDPESNKAKLMLGLGGHLKGFDTFAAYDARNEDFRLAISFAPERTKELVAVQKINNETNVLYPYRLRHSALSEFVAVELVNKTTSPVEISIECSGENLPKLREGMTLGGSEREVVEIAGSRGLQELPAGFYQYTIDIAAFQRGRQEIRRQFSFEMKDSHDWSGDSNDLNYFIQPHEAQILQTARMILLQCEEKQRSPHPVNIAQCFYDFLRSSFRYVHDPRPLHARQDRVQYATETLDLKSGDCEDLTILLVSLLESVGIRAAFVEVNPPQSEEGHIFLLFDSQENVASVVNDDSLQRYVVRQDQVSKAHLFIPLELTQLENSFEEARLDALSTYQKYGIDQHGLAKGWVKIIDTAAEE